MTPKQMASGVKTLDAARPCHVKIPCAVDLHAVGNAVAVSRDFGPDAAVFQPTAPRSRRKHERAPASCR